MKTNHRSIWVKVFKSGSSKICGRQPLKDLKSCSGMPDSYKFQYLRLINWCKVSVLSHFDEGVLLKSLFSWNFRESVPRTFLSSQRIISWKIFYKKLKVHTEVHKIRKMWYLVLHNFWLLVPRLRSGEKTGNGALLPPKKF